jgi:predicted O-methyltransferase YrrM
MANDAKKPDWLTYGVTTESVERYLYRILPERNEVLSEMEALAAEKNIPIVGPAVGRLLHQLALIAGAKRVFELGSAIGYSTIWWAEAVGSGGRVVYTDSDRGNADQARRYFERTGVADRITIKVGDAIEFLSEQKQEWDIIFCDLDKEDYPRALRVALPHLKRGGLLVADNVLWSGKVTQESPQEASTKAIVEFNRLLYTSPNLFTTIMPIRDGLAVAIKQ